MGVSEVKKELKKLEKEKLISLITDLYKNYKPVKEFFDIYINPDENKIFENYKIKVSEAFYPKRGYDYNLSEGKRAISDFKKLGVSSELLADLMLLYVETGVQYTRDYGDIDENFYSSLEKMYVQALTLMLKEDLLNKFKERAQKVVDDSENIGWGFHDYLFQVYYDFY
jgi:hypothetical protein